MDRSKLAGLARTILCGLLPVGLTALAVGVLPHPMVVYNPTPSLPQGYYVRSNDEPRRGKLIAFRVPSLGREYASRHLSFLIRGSIIKPIMAASGDEVCTDKGQGLRINGKAIAPIVDHDHKGRKLPHWIGCRRMKRDEYFVYSGRIPNSFDSRYYGPVKASEILGTFRPFYLTKS